MEMKPKAFRISVGPLLYYWPRQHTLAFYAELADSPADILYIGETVCSRRHELRADDWLDLARDLAATGKEVVLSGRTLIETGAEARRCGACASSRTSWSRPARPARCGTWAAGRSWPGRT